MNEQNLNINDLYNVILGLQLQIEENNLMIRSLTEKLEIATAPKATKKRDPKMVCSLHPKTHYIIPREKIEALIEDWDGIINNIIGDERNANVTSQWERNKDFIEEIYNNYGIPVWHYGNGKLSVHRFGGIRFHLSDFALSEDDLKSFAQLSDLEATHKKEFVRNAKREETMSRFTFKSDEIRDQVMARRYEE